MNQAGNEKTGTPDHKFQYNGEVEKETAHGLDRYETSFRSYDAQLGIFYQIDPLADLFSGINPYNFSYNNPVFFNDPLGLSASDSAVNPGNSGGAPVNTAGELIGINTAIATPTGTFAGYSFAVPSDIVKKVVEDLLEFGQVQRAVFGVMIRPMDGKMAKEMGLKITEGVVIEGINPESGSEEAELKKGDVMGRAGGKVVKSAGEIQEIVGRKRPGDKLKVTVNRAGKNKEFTVKLKTVSGSTELTKVEESDNEGVSVEKLYSGILKDNTKIREGLVINRLNKTKIRNKEELSRALENVIGEVMLEGKYPNDEKVYFYAFGM